MTKEGDSLTYEYDFGDGWLHAVTLERIHRPQSEVTEIVCLDGARACPPEDSGGIWGYQDLVDAAKDTQITRITSVPSSGSETTSIQKRLTVTA